MTNSLLFDFLHIGFDSFGYSLDGKKDYKIKKEGDTLSLMVLAPQASKDDISLEVENNILKVKITTKDWGEKDTSFVIDDRYDLSNIEANLSNGVLTITIKVKEESKPRKIQINA